MHGDRPPSTPSGSENSPADAELGRQYVEVPRCRKTLPPCHKRRTMAIRASLAIIHLGCSMYGVLVDRSIDEVLAVLPARSCLSQTHLQIASKKAHRFAASSSALTCGNPSHCKHPLSRTVRGMPCRMETIPELPVIIAFIRGGSQNVGFHHR